MRMNLVLTNHTCTQKNICKIDADVFPSCSICSWDIKECLPCLHQLKENTIEELIILTARMWRKDYLFECHGLEYTNREIHIENMILIGDQTLPLKNTIIPILSDSFELEAPIDAEIILAKKHKNYMEYTN